MPIPSVQYPNASSATMKKTLPVATRTAVPPDLGTDQMPAPSNVRRAKKTLVEFSARAKTRLVPSFTASVVSSNSNPAATAVSLCRTSWQELAVPVDAPPHPMKRADVAAEAVRVTEVPAAIVTLQVVAPFPQDNPAPETWPGPVAVTERVACAGGATSKCAKTWAS